MKIFNVKTQIDPLDHAFRSLNKATSSCSNIFYDKLPNQPLSPKPLVGLSLNAAETTANVSSVLRQESSPALSAMGATTAFNSIQGAISLVDSAKSFQTSKTMHDETGKWIAGSDVVMRISQIFGGLGFILVRFADVANNGFNRLNFLATPASIALAVSLQCFGVLYATLTALSACSIYESNTFLHRLEKAKQSEVELKALLGDLLGKGPLPFSKPLKEKDVFIHLGMELRSMLNELDPKLAENLSDKTLGQALFDPDKDYSKHLSDVLNRMGIVSQKDVKYSAGSLMTNQDLIRSVWQKENQWVQNRIFGSKGMKFIERAKEMSLYDLLSSSDPEVQKYAKVNSEKLLSELKTASEKKRHVMVAYLITGILGTVFTVLSTAILTTRMVLASTVGFFACFVVMTYADGLCFWNAYKSDAPVGKYAKAHLALHLSLGIAAIATAIAITVLTGGIAPVGVIALIGAVWIAMDVWMYYYLRQKEENQRFKSPTMKDFVEELKSVQSSGGWIPSKSIEMFHKLPKLQRKALLGSLEKNESLQRIYAGKYKTFDSPMSEDHERSVYQKCLKEVKYKKLIEKGFTLANEKLLTKERILDEVSLEKHPSQSLFYKTFYNELAKEEQAEYLRGIGKEKLEMAAEKLLETPSLEEQNPSVAFSG